MNLRGWKCMAFVKFARSRNGGRGRTGLHVRLQPSSSSVVLPVVVRNELGLAEWPKTYEVYFDSDTRTCAIVFGESLGRNLHKSGYSDRPERAASFGLFAKQNGLPMALGSIPAVIADAESLGIGTGKCITFVWPE